MISFKIKPSKHCAKNIWQSLLILLLGTQVLDGMRMVMKWEVFFCLFVQSLIEESRFSSKTIILLYISLSWHVLNFGMSWPSEQKSELYLWWLSGDCTLCVFKGKEQKGTVFNLQNTTPFLMFSKAAFSLFQCIVHMHWPHENKNQTWAHCVSFHCIQLVEKYAKAHDLLNWVFNVID